MQRLFSRSMSMGSELAHPRWEAMWNAGIKPGQAFDISSPSPALLQLINGNDFVETGKCLDPGCGRGYDIAALASPNRFIVGLEISDKAIDAAKEYLQNIPRNQYDVRKQNFFDVKEQFDFIYDYTFFCALDPSIRDMWADQMSRIVKPGGELCTLIFPIYPDDYKFKVGGPPFRVTLQDVKNRLEAVGFKQRCLEMIPKELCHPGRAGQRAIVMRTDIGEEVEGVDGNSAIGRWIRM